MLCPTCQMQNRPQARYCRNCGAALLPTHSGKMLDLCFVMDATGSMGHYIKATRTALQNFAQRIFNLALQPDVAYGLILYRDHPAPTKNPPEQNHITCYPFTHNVVELQIALEEAKTKGGGGDGPEAVADGLYQALHNPQMRWRRAARKIIVLVGDAPPHGYGHPRDNYPQGCPCESIHGSLITTVHDLREAGITIFCLGIGDDPFMHKSFDLIAETGGGQYTSIVNEVTLIEKVQAILVTELEKV